VDAPGGSLHPARMADSLIRRARIDDARAIAILHTASWQTAYRGVLPDEMLDSIDVDEREARHARNLAEPSSPEARWWVLEQQGAVVGWAATGPCRDDGLDECCHELYAIYLLPSHVGEGHGRALIQHCLADVVERGHREMVMWVLTGNERARRFYAAAGFSPDERVPSQVAFKESDALKLRMVRSLRDA